MSFHRCDRKLSDISLVVHRKLFPGPLLAGACSDHIGAGIAADESKLDRTTAHILPTGIEKGNKKKYIKRNSRCRFFHSKIKMLLLTLLLTAQFCTSNLQLFSANTMHESAYEKWT